MLDSGSRPADAACASAALLAVTPGRSTAWVAPGRRCWTTPNASDSLASGWGCATWSCCWSAGDVRQSICGSGNVHSRLPRSDRTLAPSGSSDRPNHPLDPCVSQGTRHLRNTCAGQLKVDRSGQVDGAGLSALAAARGMAPTPLRRRRHAAAARQPGSPQARARGRPGFVTDAFFERVAAAAQGRMVLFVDGRRSARQGPTSVPDRSNATCLREAGCARRGVDGHRCRAASTLRHCRRLDTVAGGRTLRPPPQRVGRRPVDAGRGGERTVVTPNLNPTSAGMAPGASEVPLVVHVVYRFDTGGLENGVVNLINHMPAGCLPACGDRADRGHRRFRRSACGDDDVALASPSHKPPGHALRLYPATVALAARLRPDIVHTRNLAALECVVPAWAAGVPVRVHGEHGRDVEDLDGRNLRTSGSAGSTVRSCSHYVALSRDLGAYLRRAVGVAARDVAQIYNGVDAAALPSGAGPCRLHGRLPVRPGAALAGGHGRPHADGEGPDPAGARVRARVQTLAPSCPPRCAS
jgi:hypothetical protein